MCSRNILVAFWTTFQRNNYLITTLNCSQGDALINDVLNKELKEKIAQGNIDRSQCLSRQKTRRNKPRPITTSFSTFNARNKVY